LKKLPAHNVAVLTGNQFFPGLISGPFHHGLIIVFSAAIAMSLGGALISLLRGRQFIYDDGEPTAVPAPAPSATNGDGPAGLTGALQNGAGPARQNGAGPALRNGGGLAQHNGGGPALRNGGGLAQHDGDGRARGASPGSGSD
jgi:hypothetical protein